MWQAALFSSQRDTQLGTVRPPLTLLSAATAAGLNMSSLMKMGSEVAVVSGSARGHSGSDSIALATALSSGTTAESAGRKRGGVKIAMSCSSAKWRPGNRSSSAFM